MTAALGVAPTDYYKFLAVETLGLQPGAAAGLVPPVDALRHDAFEAVFAGQAVEGIARVNFVFDLSFVLLPHWHAAVVD